MVDEEIEEIKRHTEEHYRVELPEVDIKYTDKAPQSSTFQPINLVEEELYQELLEGYNAGKRSAVIDYPDIRLYLEFRTKEELREGIRKALKDYFAWQEEELGIKINPEKYTIVLPTLRTFRTWYYEKYLESDQSERKLEKEKKEGPELEEARLTKNFCRFFSDHPELWVYKSKWHEMGHVLADLKNLRDDLNEGVAILYGVKGLLLGAQEGKFKIDKVKEAVKYNKINYQLLEGYKEAYERVLGDFNPDFESLEKAIQDIERRISRYVKRGETFNSRIFTFHFIKKLFRK